MKRLNQETNRPFKWGDAREDGYLFKSYKISRGVKQNGYFGEAWYLPEKFKNIIQVNKKGKARIYDFITGIINRYKYLKGCKICKNENRASSLQFHHINRNNKIYNVSEIRRSSLKQLKKIKNEIRKCQVICYNCHNEITIRENNVRVDTNRRRFG